MTKWAVAVVLLAGLCACTRFVDHPQARRDATAVAAPIRALQVHDLLSTNIQEPNGNVFVRVEPVRCSGVALEVNPPFIVSHGPVVTDGGHWKTDAGGLVYLEEIVAVYPSGFDPASAVATAGQTIDSCRGTRLAVTAMQGRTYDFGVLPRVDSGSKDIVVWSFQAIDWRCDNAFIAAYNVAVEITACGRTAGFDVTSAAKDALKRIEKLANTTA